MIGLPWYLRKSPTIFCVIAAVKFGEVAFSVIGYQVWTHQGSPPSSLLSGLAIMKVLDAAIYAFAWVGGAILAKLLIATFDRVDLSHA